MKSKQNLSILFWRSMAKKRISDGMVPIYAKITIDDGGGIKQISTNVWLMPENWDMKNKVVLGDRAQAEYDNDRLSAMRLKLKDIFRELTYNHKKVTAALLKEAYCRSIGLKGYCIR